MNDNLTSPPNPPVDRAHEPRSAKVMQRVMLGMALLLFSMGGCYLVAGAVYRFNEIQAGKAEKFSKSNSTRGEAYLMLGTSNLIAGGCFLYLARNLRFSKSPTD